MSLITTFPPTPTPALRRGAVVLVARLRRLLNRWVAAMIAYRERQARLCMLHQLERRNLDKTRIHRGPLDRAVEKALRRRRQQHLA